MTAYNVSLQGSVTGFSKVSTAIQQYNALGSISKKEQQEFATAVGLTNNKLGTYLTGLNGSNASLRGYGVSLVASTAKTIGLTVATVALNAALTWGISAIVTGLITAFTSWINKSEEITEKAQEAADKINSITDTLKTNTETVENAKKRYAELAQEVENLGKITQSQGDLSNDEYEEFLDLSNQLASVFPSLTKNYDENGNAILDLSGDVNTIVGSLDTLIQKEKELTNQKIMEEFPDVFKGFVQDLSDAETDVKTAQTEFDKINNAYQQLSNGSTAQAFDLQGNGWFTNENGEKVNLLMGEYCANLEALGLEYKKTQLKVKNQFGGDTITGYLIEATGDIDEAFTSKLETTRNNLQYAQEQLEGQKSSIDSYLNTWLQSEYTYNKIEDDGLKTAIQNLVFDFDWDNLPDGIDEDNWTEVSEYLRRNILFAISKAQDDPAISKALSEVFTNDDLTPDEKIGYIKQIQDYFGEGNIITVSLTPQLDDTTTLQKQYESAIEQTKKQFEGDTSAATEALKTAQENLQDEYDKIEKWGLGDYAEQIKNGTIQSVFGNVDMDKRTIITWSDELKQTYQDELASWDYDPEIGQIDTVFGGSGRFGESLSDNGWEVAFTPILPDGTFLSSDTVYDYIEAILQQAYADDGKVTDEELKAIDAQGMQIGDTFVKGIYAGIDGGLDYDNNGNWAETVGHLMHFSGDFGAVNLAEQAIEEAKKMQEDFDWDSWFKENSINTKEEIDNWLEIAQAANSAAEARERYVQGSTFDDETTISDVFALKDSSDNATALSNLKDQLSEVETAYQTCLSAKEEYDEQGYLSVDTLEKVISLGDEYLQYLFDEEGQVNLDAEAFQNLALARINDMETQALSNLAENIKQITNETTATDYLTKKQNELANSYTDIAASALLALHSIDGFSDSEALQGAYDSFKAQYEQLKELFAKTKAGLDESYSGTSDSAKSTTDKVKDYIEAYMDFQEKSLEKGLIDYNTYSSTISNLLKKMWKSGKISAQEYYDYTSKLLESQKSIYDKVLSAVQRRFDKEIDAIEESISAIEKQNEALEKQKDNYDSVISTVVDFLESQQEDLDKNIELIEEENETLQAQIDMYDGLLGAVTTVFDEQRKTAQSEIDLIQERIDKLQEANDEENRAIELQKARYELERARNQRTKLVYTHEDGFIYKTDNTAIRDAESNLADLEFEATINALEKEKELLQDIIDQLDEAEEKWSDIADAFDKKKNLSIAEEIFGENYKEVILASDPQVIENIMNQYISAQEKMEDNETTITSIEQKKKKYDELIKKWEQVAKKKEETTNREITSLILGKDWQETVLEDRIEDYDNFCEEYLNIQEQILSNESEIESLEEKKTIYENLKQEWSDIATAYENSIEDQYAAMVLGRDWESSIFDDRRIALNSFKNDYETIQRQIADAAWNSANEQVKAAETALNSLNKLREESKYLTAGSSVATTIVTKPSSVNKDMVQFYHDGIESGVVGEGQSSKQKHEVLKRASTGLLTDEVPAILQKGEIVLTEAQQGYLAENLIKSSIIPDYSDMIKVNLPDYSQLDKIILKPANSYSIGDIHVTCPGITSDDVAKQIGSAIQKEFNGLSLMAIQKMSITR